MSDDARILADQAIHELEAATDVVAGIPLKDLVADRQRLLTCVAVLVEVTNLVERIAKKEAA